MSFQDIITNQQKLVQVMTGKMIEEALEDDNHRYLLHYLFQGPLTVEELKIAFKQSGNEKSDKTIYRYLNKLKKAGLVIEAGKRIYTDKDNQIKTQTLFARIAKVIFTPFNKADRDPNLKKKSLKITSLILKEKLGQKGNADLNCLQNKIDNLVYSKQELIASYFQDTDNSEIISLIQTMDIAELFPILDIASWILLLIEKPEIINQILDCF
ncbi:MAG TPA: ArsR family transcriptional regulator [candidate division Zixibacteria bacterium]|nr:ArsR family transcriptional regulator [candidate division Zixibacteria bacterium]